MWLLFGQLLENLGKHLDVESIVNKWSGCSRIGSCQSGNHSDPRFNPAIGNSCNKTFDAAESSFMVAYKAIFDTFPLAL